VIDASFERPVGSMAPPPGVPARVPPPFGDQAFARPAYDVGDIVELRMTKHRADRDRRMASSLPRIRA